MLLLAELRFQRLHALLEGFLAFLLLLTLTEEADPGRSELPGGRVYLTGHLGVSQLDVNVAHARAAGQRRRPIPWQLVSQWSSLHLEDHAKA